MSTNRLFHRALVKSAFLVALGCAIGTAVAPAEAAAKPLDLSSLGERRPYRLRMELEMKKTSDSNENHLPFSDNSEDEIYYSLAGLKMIGKKTTTFPRKEVRPNNPSKDVWEMGPNSNDVLHRSIFEEKLSAGDKAAFTLIVSEQDNAQLKQIEDLIKHAIEAAVTYLAQEVGADDFLGTGKFDDKKALDTLVSDTKALLWAMKDKKDQPLGVVEIVMHGPRLEVKAAGNTTKVIDKKYGKAELELTGFGAKYRLKVFIEDGNLPAPKHRVFLDRDKDQCSQPKLWVESKNGDVLVQKGETKDVYIKDDRYDWHCGSKDEDDSSNAPDATNLAVTTRAPSGSEIRWEWFSEKTAVADYK